jgi:hypothetical protein
MTTYEARLVAAIETCPFIAFTKLCEAYGADTAFVSEMISDQAPFSWGDNNRTLITATRLRDRMLDCIDSQDLDPLDPMLNGLKMLDQFYIDMEN